MIICPVILAGGSGTRLWPLSREYHPKQFLPLFSDQSMLQDTILRLTNLNNSTDPLIVCNEAHRFLVINQMRDVEVSPLEVIVEPEGRNTAAALTLAAIRLTEIQVFKDEDPLMLVTPSDHVIHDQTNFRSSVLTGSTFANDGQLVTFGVTPRGPETGFGYIRKGFDLGGVNRVNKFVEKPDIKMAKEYVESGDYLWNCGVFMMRASVWLSQIGRFRSDILEACISASKGGDVDGHFYRPDQEEFLRCPSESIDYAVMENIGDDSLDGNLLEGEDGKGCVVLPLDVGWSDLGAWSSVHAEREQDSQGNVIDGDVYTQSTNDSLLISTHKMLATVGISDLVVVETSDAVLVAHKDHVENVKKIVGILKSERRPEHEYHRKVDRPWGSYEVIDKGDGFQVKRLTVNPRSSVSYQRHTHRAEHWVVVRGTAKVTRNDKVFILKENESTYMPKGSKHRLENPEDRILEVVEVQTGSYLGEDDIVRFDDNYSKV